MKAPRFTKIVANLPGGSAFVGPETMERRRGRPFKARLGANESIFGPSPKSIAAMQEAAAGQWMYGDPEKYDLRQGLAAHFNLPPETIQIGEGIDGLLDNLVRMLIEPGDHVVTTDGAYPTFNSHVAIQGGVLHKVPFRDDFEDPDALFAKAAEVGAKLIYLSNPNNPMGSFIGAERMQQVVDNVPEGAVLLLDEAYVEFAPEDEVLGDLSARANVVRMRTFSKAYGLAGARVGYALAHPDIIDHFAKVVNHYGVNRVALIGALAALEDQAYLAQLRADVAAANARIAEIGRANGLVPLPSSTNFVALDCGRDGEFMRRVIAELAERDVFVRGGFSVPQDRCIRVSAGRPADLDLFEAALPGALKAAAEQ